MTGFRVRRQNSCTIFTIFCFLQYISKIGPDGIFYDRGVKISSEGMLEHEDAKMHAFTPRGTCSLHSLYLLLWANFGTFCLSLLTQPTSYKNLHGNIMSKTLSLRKYCLSQLRLFWNQLLQLGFTEEARSFFVLQAMNNFLVVG